MKKQKVTKNTSSNLSLSNIKCASCGKQLDTEQVGHDIFVSPCSQCLDDAENRGWERHVIFSNWTSKWNVSGDES